MLGLCVYIRLCRDGIFNEIFAPIETMKFRRRSASVGAEAEAVAEVENTKVASKTEKEKDNEKGKGKGKGKEKEKEKEKQSKNPLASSSSGGLKGHERAPHPLKDSQPGFPGITQFTESTGTQATTADEHITKYN